MKRHEKVSASHCYYRHLLLDHPSYIPRQEVERQGDTITLSLPDGITFDGSFQQVSCTSAQRLWAWVIEDPHHPVADVRHLERQNASIDGDACARLIALAPARHVSPHRYITSHNVYYVFWWDCCHACGYRVRPQLKDDDLLMSHYLPPPVQWLACSRQLPGVAGWSADHDGQA